MALPETRKNFTAYCESFNKRRPIGSITGEETKLFPFVIFLYPIAFVTSLSVIFQILLKPLGQVAFVSQMLAGIALGPSVLGQNERFSEKIFSPKVMAVLNVFDAFGLFYMIFLLSVRIDISIVKKSGKLGIVIGIASYVLPFIVNSLVAFFLKQTVQMDEELRHSLIPIVGLESTINFHVVLVLLTELKLLNSEIGRIALSSSFISGVMSFFVFSIGSNAKDTSTSKSNHVTLLMNLSAVFMIFVAVFALRPTMFWMMRQTPEGKPLKHSHVLAINIMFLSSCFFAEATGFHGLFGAIILGVSTPISSPMGSCFVDRSEYFVWAVFVPCFIITTGRRVNFFAIRPDGFFAVQLLILVSNSVKLSTIIIPSLYYKLPFTDALSLGLVLTSRGIYDIQIFSRVNQRRMISDECFSIMVISATLYTAFAIPLVRVIYDSSKRYTAYRRRTVQDNGRHSELRILACIHDPNDVLAIINFLQASESRRSSLGIYVMNLEEYIGSSMPQVIVHRLNKEVPSSTPSKADTIIDAFRHFEQQNKDLISVQCFTVIAPYVSMHDDICAMAFDKSTSLVIIPFQKTESAFIKNVAKRVLKTAPCSVGILFGRGMFLDIRLVLSRKVKIHVCVAFIGGPDDREALAYGARMAENHCIMLTIMRFIVMENSTSDLMEENDDSNMINDIRMNTMDNKNVEYVKRTVTEGADTTRVLNCIANDYDLILAGRRHDSNSQVLIGLSAWNEFDDLGIIGDILVSSHLESKASVLVLQQQASFG